MTSTLIRSAFAAVCLLFAGVANASDLAISSITDGSATYRPGQWQTYTVTVTNNGTGSANNALFRSPAIAGQVLINVTCGSASGGASCASWSSSWLAAMETGSGIAIPTFPANSSVTFTLSGAVHANATAALARSAIVVNPSGNVDANTANNTATDTNTATDVSTFTSCPNGADYVEWTGNFANGTGAVDTGSGVFPMLPSLTYATGGGGSISITTPETLAGTSGTDSMWTNIFGESNVSENTRLNYSLGSFSSPTVQTIIFATPTPISGWGFMIGDIDVEQIRIDAFDNAGAQYPVSEVHRWYRGVNDPSTDDGTNIPRWLGPSSSWIMGSGAAGAAPAIPPAVPFASDPSGPVSTDRPSAWFTPSSPVKRLVITYQNLGAGSNRLYMASCLAPAPSVRLTKSLPGGRNVASDQFNLTITGTGGPSTVTTTGTGSTATGTALIATATAGATYTFAETGAGATNINTYASTYSCTNTVNGATTSGTGRTFQITPAIGDNWQCVFTNADNTAPIAPVVTTPANGSTTSNTQPLVSGTAEANSTVTVIIDGVAAGTTVANGTGAWSFTPPSALSQGSHSVRATATDAGGNVSPTSNTNTFTVDNVAPAAPVVVTPANGSTTSNAQPLMSGTAEANSTVTVFIDGVAAGTTVANGTGAWSFTPPTPLSQASHTVRATSTDAAGNVSPNSNTNTFTVDTTAPAAPVVVTPANGSTTSNAQPLMSGTAEANSTVTVFIDGVAAGTTAANGTGAWSFTPPSALAQGPHTVRATSTDAAGNVSPNSNTNTFTVDTTAPSAPVVTTPANGSTTANAQPLMSGTAEPNSTVTVFIDGVAAGTTTANGTGAWSFTPPTALSQASHTVRATSTDAAGNISPNSNTNTFTVDTTAPAAPVVTTPANGSTTANAQPAISGTAEANSTVTVIIDGVTAGTTTTNGTGAWTFTPPSALTQGSHTVRATATDAAGNLSPTSNTNTFTVDTVAPSAPVVTTPANGSTTGNAQPLISGTAEANSTVTVIIDGVAAGTTTANGSGAWSFTPPSALAQGPHTVRATSTDAAGNVSPNSNTNTFTVDTSAPAAPVVTTPANGSTTANVQPPVSGTAEANSTVTVIIDGAAVGTTTANASGAWTFTPPTALSSGSHTVRATSTDAGGNVSPNSNTNNFTVDTTAPDTLIVTGPSTLTSSSTANFTFSASEVVSGYECSLDGAAFAACTASNTFSSLADGAHTLAVRAIDLAGNVDATPATWSWTIDTTAPAAPVVVAPANGSTTSNAQPTVSGTAEANSLVTVIIDGVTVGTALTDGSGAWTFPTPSPLAEGSHTVRATTTDAAGNTSPSSTTNTFTVDTSASAPPVVVTPANGSATSNTQPVVSGTAEANSTVTVIIDGATAGTTTANASGAWSFTPPTPLTEGSHSVRATSTDGVGNVSPPSNINAFTVDTTAPGAPVVTTPANGSTTADNSPAVTGTAEANSTVTVFIDGVAAGTTTANGAGAWTFTPATPLADGAHTVRATATDAAGNVSPNSNTNTFTVDTNPPDTTISTGPSTLSNSSTANFTFTASEVVSGYQCSLDGAAFAPCTASTTFSALADGPHTLSVRAVDAAGNVDPTPATWSWTIDTAVPVAPVVTTPANGSTLANAQPTVSGTAEANSLVTVIIDGVTAGTTTADGTGAWSFTPPTPLADGTHTVRATSTDGAGNVSPNSNTNTFRIDTLAPAAPVVTTPANGSTVSSNQPVVSGTAEANSTVTVIIDGVTAGTTTANGSGAWSFTPPTALTQGSHTVRATSTDAAGNVSVNSNTNTFTVDTSAPTAPVVTTPANGSTTANAQPVVSGTAEANSTVTVIIDGVTVGTTSADGAGAWTFTPPTALTAGSHTVTATATDAGGNLSPSSNTNTFTVDPTAPAAPVVTTPANGSVTANTQPVMSGTAEANSTVTVIIDGLTAGTTTANASGAWSFTPPTPLTDGSHTVRVTATDTAGNVSPSSNTNTFRVDTLAPTAPVVTTPANGSSTANTQPLISGTAEANSVVTVIIEGVTVGTTTANGTGAWSFTPPTALSQGSHTVRATSTDAAGNVSPNSNTNTFTVDTTAPSIVIATPANGTRTNDTTPTLSGTAEVGTTVVVELKNGAGTVVQTLTPAVSGTGAWTIDATTLAQGAYTVTATATDAVGNSATAGPNAFTVDTETSVAIATPVNGSTTTDSTPTLSGTAEPGATVTLNIENAAGTTVQTATATANASGSWSVDATVLADGNYTVTALATDAAGNVASAGPNSFAIDTVLPTVVIVSPADGSTTSNVRPGLTTEPGASVALELTNGSGTVIFTTTVTADVMTGAWSASLTADLANGPYTLEAQATDIAGNQSLAVSNDFTVDTSALPIAIVTPANGASVSNAQPPITGTTAPNTAVTLVLSNTGGTLQTLTTTSDATGAWSVTPSTLTDGAYTATATVQSTGGVVSTATSGFTVDTVVPTVALTTPVNGEVTGDNTPTVTGTSEPGTDITVEIKDSAGVVVATLTTVTNSMGNWSVTPTTPLVDGAHSVTATARDHAGNTAVAGPRTFTVDTTAPVLTITSPTQGMTTALRDVAVTGTGEPGLTVSVELRNAAGTVVGLETATVAVDGTYSVTFQNLADGGYTAEATSEDDAGNISTDDVDFTVTSAQPTLTVTSPADGLVTNNGTLVITGTTDGVTVEVVVRDAAGNEVTRVTTTPGATGGFSTTLPTALTDGDYTVTVTATGASGATTTETRDVTVDTQGPTVSISQPGDGATVSTSTPSITGNTEPGATVTVRVDGVVVGTTVADSTGQWSVGVTTPLPEGPHTVTVVATDPTGNTGQPDERDFTVDLSAPVVTITSPAANAKLEDTTPTITGTADPGATVTVRIDGVVVGTTVADSMGRWSYTSAVLAVGAHSVEASTTDSNGRSGSSGTVPFEIIDRANVTITSPGDGTQVTGPSVTVTGTGEPGSTITVTAGGQTLTVVVEADGTWRATFPNVPAGEITVEVDDGQSSDSATITVTTSPAAGFIISGGGIGSGCTQAPGNSGGAWLWLLGLLLLVGRRARSARALVAAPVLFFSVQAQAQNLPAFELERVRLNPSAQDGLLIEGGELLTQQRAYRAALTFHYQHNPLVLFRDNGGAPVGAFVSSRITAHASAAFAITDWLEASGQIPVVLYQGSQADLSTHGFATPSSAVAAGTPWLGLRAGVLQQRRGNGIDLSIGLSIGLPAGAGAALTRDQTVSGIPTIALGRTVTSWLRIGGNVSVLIRNAQRLTTDAMPTQEVGSIVSPGLVLSTLGDGLRGELSARVDIPLTRSAVGAEVDLGLRYPIFDLFELYAVGGPGFGSLPGTPTFRVLAGIALAPKGKVCAGECTERDTDKDGVADSCDVCPQVPGPKERAGCPERDADSDGLLDSVDRCPWEAGPKDNAGCAIADADRDGVADALDVCPQVPGPKETQGCPDSDGDGFVDNVDACPSVPGVKELNGCPDPDADSDGVADRVDNCRSVPGPADNEGCPVEQKQLVTITKDKLIIKDKVHFGTGKANILASSRALLEQIARVLKDHPEIEHLTIEGHTDDRGKASANVTLSQRRAEAVRKVLIEFGVTGARLKAKGYGPSRPAASNDTEAGREANRRTEFFIGQNGEAPK